jgi:hypothetical protein
MNQKRILKMVLNMKVEGKCPRETKTRDQYGSNRLGKMSHTHTEGKTWEKNEEKQL